MTERKKVTCRHADETCRGRIRKVMDLVQFEVYGKTVWVTLCDKHQQDNADEV